MSTQTATVETLTATVRILQVGNRQVTASMVKQLDDLGHPTYLSQVWGRVKVRLDGYPCAMEYAIGVDGDGTLVLGGSADYHDQPLPLLVLGGAR